jgi:hypothetical protein
MLYSTQDRQRTDPSALELALLAVVGPNTVVRAVYSRLCIRAVRGANVPH